MVSLKSSMFVLQIDMKLNQLIPENKKVDMNHGTLNQLVICLFLRKYNNKPHG